MGCDTSEKLHHHFLGRPSPALEYQFSDDTVRLAYFDHMGEMCGSASLKSDPGLLLINWAKCTLIGHVLRR